ncbi:glucosamine-6-phosphate deaminase [Thalassobacillus pellis]|uniref:glucosamine-6-phosphate deaminase n=1 Tax=Thalassobacillus pellis TaxID=748008 RepID=UPI0019602E35|nr:glucosamine-6-phosphate deaminase [Thalassobacillus pellis]MBM7553029.1 glucosamine-6-phosphate deaminase [Thalassobacillus pellis]
MKVRVTENYQHMSATAADMIAAQIMDKPDAVLGLATGSTPLGTYNELIRAYNKSRLSFSGVRTLNLDEYVGLPQSHPQSYHTFMEENLFKRIDINPDQTFIPNGMAEDRNKECRRYENLIDEIGPPDLQVLGIGRNGHIGFNEPGTSFASTTHLVKLADSTREANARFFQSKEKVPTHAITMGITSILKSKKIILLASGEEKMPAIKHLLTGDIGEKFPASALLNHPDVTLIVDELAYPATEEENDAE